MHACKCRYCIQALQCLGTLGILTNVLEEVYILVYFIKHLELISAVGALFFSFLRFEELLKIKMHFVQIIVWYIF